MAISWCFEDEFTEHSRSVLLKLKNSKALVPHIWFLEVLNVLHVAERKERIRAEQSEHFIKLFSSMPIEADCGLSGSFNKKVLYLARKHHLSAYDAAYLELALRCNAPLASLDKHLCTVAKKEGIQLL
jgi:predicted nucleic acid-binding protein